MLRALMIILPLALAIYALVDLVQTEDERVQGLPKLAWVALIVLIWVVGPLAWLLGGKKGRRWLPGLAARPSGPAGPSGGRPLAPDDDPDFLRGLGRRSGPPPRSPAAPPPATDPPAPESAAPDPSPEDPRSDGEDDDPPLTTR